MTENLRIIYLEHSGFAVEVDKDLLIFDYARGETPTDQGLDQGYLTRDFIAEHEHCYVFVSHGHDDHFNPAVFDWQDLPGIQFILGHDIDQRKWPGRRLAPGEGLYLPEITVNAHASTDLGVSFLVKIAGFTLFHAGDLNLWHWRNESTLREIEQAEQAWQAALLPLTDAPVDLAFFPVDPRQGSFYDAGASQYVLQVKPQVFIPMHWQGRTDVALEFARRNRNKRTEIYALIQPGEDLVLGRGEGGRLRQESSFQEELPTPSGPIEIQMAAEEDLPKWLTLAQDVGEIMRVPNMDNNPTFLDYATRKLQQSNAALAMDKETGQCAGAVGFSRTNNSITWLAVSSGCRRQGIGSRLVEFALGQLDRTKPITVNTYPAGYEPGRAARELYKKHGFVETTREVFLVDGLEMVQFTLG